MGSSGMDFVKERDKLGSERLVQAEVKREVILGRRPGMAVACPLKIMEGNRFPAAQCCCDMKCTVTCI